jgi:SAM-dependent methyltransferase
MHRFTCNICGAACAAETPARETPSCERCGSTVRFRWIVHALSTELFGESIPLHEFPVRKDIRGIGMSDPEPVAAVLARRFNYVNTSYHKRPRFDITNPTGDLDFDFVIASEVFEHVAPPVQSAFDNLRGILKPGGFAVFSTPNGPEGNTIEHFPGLFDWHVAPLATGPVLLNRTIDGKLETFEDLHFHGGAGMTLEMRVFSEGDLMQNCITAGFGDIGVAEDYPGWGIHWEPWARGLILRNSGIPGTKQADARE